MQADQLATLERVEKALDLAIDCLQWTREQRSGAVTWQEQELIDSRTDFRTLRQQLQAPAFNHRATCSPALTQCPRCNNPHHACDGGKASASPAAPQVEVVPPRPAGYNDADTDPTSPLERWGKPKREGGQLLLQPVPDGYWTPWHIANELLRSATPRPQATPPSSPATAPGP